MSYLDELRSFSEKPAEGLPTKPTKGGSVSFVGATSPHISRKRLREWRATLSGLDMDKPRAGIDPQRWRQLVDCAAWVVWNYGEAAARGGWMTADLFGLWPDKPGWGGLIDRMQDARNLKLSDRTATWRPLFGPAEKFHRGGYPDLAPFWRAE